VIKLDYPDRGFVMTTQLYIGDNFHVISKFASSEFDLIYVDPPYFSGKDYRGKGKEIQFTDVWEWDADAELRYDVLANTKMFYLVQGIGSSIGKGPLMSYLTYIAILSMDLHRVLLPTGSLYFQCDTNAAHYIKLLLDGVFGYKHFRNDISWVRTSILRSSASMYRKTHDTILFYTKSDDYTFNMPYTPLTDNALAAYSHKDKRGPYQHVSLMTRKGRFDDVWKGVDPQLSGEFGMYWIHGREKREEWDRQGLIYWPEKEGAVPRLKYYLEQSKGVKMTDAWVDIKPPAKSERVGYQTQKPLALIERIIKTSSNEGDLVLDPFSGSGTTAVVCQNHNRDCVSIDKNPDVIQFHLDRLGNNIDVIVDNPGPM
jgi:DNA modification methylase